MKIFPCDECNAIIGSPEGLAAHKKIRHDKEWNKQRERQNNNKYKKQPLKNIEKRINEDENPALGVDVSCYKQLYQIREIHCD